MTNTCMEKSDIKDTISEKTLKLATKTMPNVNDTRESRKAAGKMLLSNDS